MRYSLLFFIAALVPFNPSVSAQGRFETLAINLLRGDTETKRDALFQIRNLRSAKASLLAVPALSDSEEIVRATAVSSVVFLEKQESARLLIPLLADKAPFVRRECAFALGSVGSAAATTPLIATMQHDKDPEVRSAAAVALGKLGDANAVDALLRVLQKKPNEETEFIRRAAARSIGQIAQIIHRHRIEVVTPQNFLPREYKLLEVPKFEELSLRYPQFREAGRALSSLLKDKRESDDTRREAAFSLGAIGGGSEIESLKTNLNSTDPFLAEICEEAMEKVAAAYDPR